MQAPRSFGAFGVTLVLGLFGASGLVQKCNPAPAPAPAPAPSVDVSACLQSVNNERTSRGLAPVVAHPALTKAAQLHSTEQAKRQKMTHTGANGSNAGWRISAQGYNWGMWGENVAAGQPDCASVMSAWMNSPGHKANILNPKMMSIGMGAAASSTGTIYWTMDLAAPR